MRSRECRQTCACISDTGKSCSNYTIFGIPLSAGALLTGLTLGVGTRWGIFRYLWVKAKLFLIVSIMFVGGFIIGPAQKVMLDGTGDASVLLIAAASYDMIALAVATGLSVFKPGRPFRRGGPTAAPKPTGHAS